MCDKAFPSKKDVEQHGDVHENVRPFPCTICDSKFKRAHHLTNHYKTIHGIGKDDIGKQDSQIIEENQQW